MNICKLEGIVIKEVNVKDSDKIITVYSRELGKVQLYVKGARSIKSPFLAASQLFANCTFTYNEKTDIKFLNQVNIINGFENIRFKNNKLYYGMYFLEFLDKTTELENPQENIYEFLLRTLHKLNDTEYDVRLLRCIFELKMLSLLGYTPEITQCIKCNNKIDEDFCFFSLDDCGLLCSNCNDKNNKTIKLTKSTIYTMQYILFSEKNKIFSFNVSEQILSELKIIIQELVTINICQKFKTLDFLSKI